MMRAVVQRVSKAAVDVDDLTVGEIGRGLVVLVAARRGDGDQQADQLAGKIVNLRMFPDRQGKFNLSAQDISCELLIVSQFTLYGDTRKGRRPSFVDAAPWDEAERLVSRFVETVRATDLRVATGRFGAHMMVRLCNDGPVTLIVDVDGPGG